MPTCIHNKKNKHRGAQLAQSEEDALGVVSLSPTLGVEITNCFNNAHVSLFNTTLPCLSKGTGKLTVVLVRIYWYILLWRSFKNKYAQGRLGGPVG